MANLNQHIVLRKTQHRHFQLKEKSDLKSMSSAPDSSEMDTEG
jgi:hypothetical protein